MYLLYIRPQLVHLIFSSSSHLDLACSTSSSVLLHDTHVPSLLSTIVFLFIVTSLAYRRLLITIC